MYPVLAILKTYQATYIFVIYSSYSLHFNELAVFLPIPIAVIFYYIVLLHSFL